MSKLFIQINDKDGKHFRKYTEDSLQMLFDVSPSAANFELMILVEGLVFMSLRTHFMILGKEYEYDLFLKNDDRLSTAINKLAAEGIIEKKLKNLLSEYRSMRNEIVHNMYRMKSLESNIFPKFRNYSYVKAYEILFKKGMEIFNEFSKFLVPGQPSKEAYINRFRGINQST